MPLTIYYRYLFEVIDTAQELLTEYNDKLKGRCSICLEDFKDSANGDEEASFSACDDLIRLNACYHRFHLQCVYHDWFIPRTKDIGFKGIFS